MIRRLPLPSRMHLRRHCATRGGRSARHLLRAAWRRAFGVVALVVCAASATETTNPTHRAEHAIAGAVIDVVTIEAERVVAPRWTHAHPVLAQVVAGVVVGTAATIKESIDVHSGPEAFHHQLGDIAFTEAGGVAAGIGFTYAFRF